MTSYPYAADPSEESGHTGRRRWLRFAYLLLIAAALWLLAGLLHSSHASAESPPPGAPVASVLDSVDRVASVVTSLPHSGAQGIPALTQRAKPAKTVTATAPAHSAKPSPATPPVAARPALVAPVKVAVDGLIHGVDTTAVGIVDEVHTAAATVHDVVQPAVDRVVTPIVSPILTPIFGQLSPILGTPPPVVGPSPIDVVLPIAGSQPALPLVALVHGSSTPTSPAALVAAGSGQAARRGGLDLAVSRSGSAVLDVPAGTSASLVEVGSPTHPAPAPSTPLPAAPSGSVAVSAQQGGPLALLSVEPVPSARLEATGRARLSRQPVNPRNTAADPAFSPD